MGSTNRAIQMLIVHYVLALELAEISGANASNSLTSFPPQVNGSVTACVGDEISLTCSRNNPDVAITQWTISSPVNCSSDIGHNAQTATPSHCGPFTFHNITRIAPNVAQLSSTAVAIASSEINGSVIECTSEVIMPISVGDVSLCIVELSEPVNLRCMEILHGLLVSWDVVTDSCVGSSIVHDITVVRENDSMIIVSVNNFRDTQIEITNSSLELSQNYSIQVRTKLLHGTCETGDTIIVCGTSDDLLPTTSPTTTAPTTITLPALPGSETEKGKSMSAAAVAVPIVVILALVAAIVIGILIIFGYYYKRRGKLPFNFTLPFRKLKDQSSQTSSTSHHPKPDLQHTRAPDGAEYTCIDKVTKSTELQHTRAPDGAEYTCIDKITKSKDHEAQRDHSSDGSSNDSIEKIKNQDMKSDTEAKDDKPPPKPKRLTNTMNKPKSKNKSESPEPPPSDPNYEDIDKIQ